MGSLICLMVRTCDLSTAACLHVPSGGRRRAGAGPPPGARRAGRCPSRRHPLAGLYKADYGANGIQIVCLAMDFTGPVARHRRRQGKAFVFGMLGCFQRQSGSHGSESCRTLIWIVLSSPPQALILDNASRCVSAVRADQELMLGIEALIRLLL